MGNLDISYEQVSEAADPIHKSGEIPTIEKVRVELGNTGSNSTLSRHLRRWKQVRTQVPPLPENSLSLSLKTTLTRTLLPLKLNGFAKPSQWQQ